MTTKDIFRKVKPLLVFALFGGLATIIEAYLYHLMYEVYGISNLVSTFFSWTLVVLFCFVTNKAFVYHAPSWSLKTLWKELVGFVSCRLGTGALNLLLMILAVDVMKLPAVLMKILVAILLGFVNFAVGRLVIFKRP